MFFKLNSTFKFVLKQFRNYSVQSNKYICEKLTNRSIIKLEGEDSCSLLQGLITNNVTHLQDKSQSIYSFFLNNKGRIMFDNIISKVNDKHCYYIESDLKTINLLEKHLKKYKLRKKVTIKIEEKLNIYSFINISDILNMLPKDLATTVVEDNIINSNENKISIENYYNYKDPRIRNIGFRIVTDNNLDLKLNNINFYKLCRYWLGIAEGCNEMPNESCFALEYNGDYMEGISFNKGCYIGQELTARSYHTGVIRKRIMPIVIDNPEKLPQNINKNNEIPIITNLQHIDMNINIDKINETNSSELGIDIYDDNNKKVGKLRGLYGKYGIALLRVNECLKLTHFNVGTTTGRCFQPTWWPHDAIKQQIS